MAGSCSICSASTPKFAREEAGRLLELVGMSGYAERPCGELAYGDLKRLELAVALANQPKLLLMDEPTAGMAPRERIELMRAHRQASRGKNPSACSSPSTTWTWCSNMPTASWCSTAAA